MNSAATLEFSAATFARAGTALGPALSGRSDARRLGLVGDWAPFFQALTGEARVASGAVSVLGTELEFALREGVVGFAACDAPLPESLTVREYLRHAARLTHGSRSRAQREAEGTLERYGLGELASRALGQLVLVQRRAIAIAAATLTAPPLVCLETPARGLDAPSADYIGRLSIEACRQARLIVSVTYPSSPSPARTLLDACEELLVLDRGLLVAQGVPAEVLRPSSRYAVTVSGPRVDEYATSLRASGYELSAQSGHGRYIVQAPNASSTDLLLDGALECGLVVLELEPLFDFSRS